MFRKFLAPVAGAALLMVTAVSAQAATTDFKLFSKANGNGIGGNPAEGQYVNPLAFNSFQGPAGTLNVHAFTQLEPIEEVFNLNNVIFGASNDNNVRIDVNNDGLGVKNSLFDQSEIDNTGRRDFIVLDFGNDNWRPETAQFSFVDDPSGLSLVDRLETDTIGVYGFGDDGLVVDLTSAVAFLLAFDDSDVVFEGDPGSNNNGRVTVDFDTDETFRYLAFTGPGGLGWDTLGDDFRLRKFSGTVVPLPAALPLLATALAGFGVISWRRRRQLAA